MSSRDIVLKTINHEQPERVPWTLYLSSELKEKIEKIWGTRENWPCPPDDTIRILWEVEVDNVTPDVFKDSFGCEWKREYGGYIFVNPPLIEPDAGDIPVIDLVPQSDIDKIIETRKLNPDKFIFYQFTTTFGERLWCLRGLEQSLITITKR